MALLYEKKGKVAYLTINRPQALNSLDPETFQELSDALIDFRKDDERLVAIITGAGDRAFCAGADIKTTIPFLKESRGEWWRQPPVIMRGLEVWKPLIAAINGFCLGGGLEVALACDFRIASEKATFGVPEVRLGLIPGWGGASRLPRFIPRGRAAEMLMTGESIDAQEAHRLGLVNKVLPPQQLMPTCEEWAQRLCSLPPLSVRAAKEMVVKGSELSLEDALRLETKLEDFLLASEDLEEGTRAFIEKRKGVFKGK